jgi:hypothetical protein
MIAAEAQTTSTSSTMSITGAPMVLVHYMPWYESKPVSGNWGWHWTMNHFNPDQPAADGYPAIASQVDPLLGAYDSGDEDLLVAHVSLIKLAGINGVVIDWYGTSTFRDYPIIHRNTERLIDVIQRAGLVYAICYEDQSVKHRMEELNLSRSEGMQQGLADAAWLARAFADPAYARLKGRPILPIFGPQYFERDEWPLVMQGIEPVPLLLGLPHRVIATGMHGPFGWPPVTGGVEIPESRWSAYLDELHAPLRQGRTVISVAFPGFHDIYDEAGVHPSYGYIPHNDGATFQTTWSKALQSGAPVIQIATWNDFGEGTVIEPTREHGTRDLAFLAAQCRGLAAENPAMLQVPIAAYFKKKSEPNNPALMQALKALDEAIFQGDQIAMQAAYDAIDW